MAMDGVGWLSAAIVVFLWSLVLNYYSLTSNIYAREMEAVHLLLSMGDSRIISRPLVIPR